MIRIASPTLEGGRTGWSMFGRLLFWATRHTR